MKRSDDEALKRDYERLQASDHFYYMRTKLFSDNEFRRYTSPYDSPYEAFINYMNVLSDFILRVEEGDRKRDEKPETRKTKKR